MDIEVLGPFEIRRFGKDVAPTAAKPRKVLCLLAVNANQVVSVNSLIEELWDGKPPRSAMTTLQTYILHLRNRIAATAPRSDDPSQKAKNVLVTRLGGYSLDVENGNIDIWKYKDLEASGHRAIDSGDYERATDCFRSALDLWRGPALVDVEPGPRLEVEIVRLEESRLSLLAQAVDAELHMGHHHRLLGELAALATEYPMHEHLQAQYMLALYRSGRRHRALEVYSRLRVVLNEELGLEPSPDLEWLQHAILNSDATLDLDCGNGLCGGLRIIKS